MIRLACRTALLATAIASCPAFAAPVLLATGTLTGSTAGSGADLSGLTGTLENGLPANVLGGIGSALAWAGGNTFLAAPDRGPNALKYSTALDDTVSYISRFQTLQLALTPNGSSGTPFVLSPVLVATTLLSSPTPLNYGTGAGLKNNDGSQVVSGVPATNTTTKNYFTGRSDNFVAGSSGNPDNARLDPEGLRVSGDGKSVFVSDEYGPYVYQFDRATGTRLRTYTLPANLDIAKLSPNGASEISGNTTGRVANKGMEGLAITPDGKTLVGIMQAPLLQDQMDPSTPGNLLRIVTIDIATGVTHEYGYLLSTGSGVSEITALNDHQFLVDERDGKGLGDGSNAKNKNLYLIDLTGATDITALGRTAAIAAAVPKSPFLDLVALLGANGVTPANVPSKIEGLAFGADVLYNGIVEHTLFVANDNDFTSVSGPNVFYAIGFSDADVAALGAAPFVAQRIPEPSTLPLLGLGVAGLIGAVHRRRSLR